MALALAAALVTWVGTGLMRRYALARNLLDHPGARSSHRVAQPRGGGLAMVVVLMAGNAIGLAFGEVSQAFALTVSLGGGLVAGVGLLDDHGEVSVSWRLLAHLMACLLAVVVLDPVVALVLPTGVQPLGMAGVGLTLLAGVALINLYNFMDGIDGMAVVEFLCVCTGLLVVGAGNLSLPTWLGVAVGLGFLFWNWSPARIFMGDVGSGFLGFYLGALLLAGVAAGELVLWAPLILLGVFVADTTVTLFTRALTGQRLSEAHCMHAYQLLARRWGHAPVTIGACVMNLLWLLPLAWLAAREPRWGLLLMVLAWAPLFVLALAVGAGRLHAEAAEHE